MISFLRPSIAVLAAFVLQVTVLPAFIADPFKPNLLLVVAVWISLTVAHPWGAVILYLLGLLQDTVSGLYLGLNAISYLLTFLVLNNISHRLYTDSRYLMILAVFVATLACGIAQLLMLALFSSADGIFAPLLSSLLPQGFVNALAASLLFGFLSRPAPEEKA